jgi:predicted RNA-binding protein with PUA-like domain
MAYLLLKTEPSTYAFADLQRERKTTWDGIANPTALKNLRAAQPGDLAVIYHTGSERRAVGIARVAAVAGDAVELVPVKALATPVGLEALKASAVFRDSPLVRIGRLSVVPLSARQWQALLALGKTTV